MVSDNITQRGDVHRVQDRTKDRSLWNTKVKIFNNRLYTINHHKLLSVLKVGFKPFQDLSFKTKAIAQSFEEKDQQCRTRWTCPTEGAQHICYHQLHGVYRAVLSVKLSRYCVGVCMLTGVIRLDRYQ